MKEVVISELQTSNPNKVLRIGVDYSRGGPNVWGGYLDRGYYAFCRVIEKRDGYTFLIGGAGGSVFLDKAARFSEKALQKYVADGSKRLDDVLKWLVEKTLQELGLSIVR